MLDLVGMSKNNGSNNTIYVVKNDGADAAHLIYTIVLRNSKKQVFRMDAANILISTFTMRQLQWPSCYNRWTGF